MSRALMMTAVLSLGLWMKKTQKIFSTKRLPKGDVNILSSRVSLLRETNARLAKQNLPCFANCDMVL
jgi:hypothetical protein